jgi:hypothetical protein
MTFADLKLKLQILRRETNLHSHIRWIEYIAGREFLADWYKLIERPSFLLELVNSAKQIVEEDIYNRYQGPETGRIKASFVGINQRTSTGTNLVVYSDPSVAPAKGPFRSGGVPGEFSYAAFFEDAKFNTFLPPQDDPHDVRRFRPFYFSMQLAQSRISNERSVRQTFQLIRKRMPRVGNRDG